MKICLINNLYYPYNKGGAEKIVDILKQAYEQENHEVVTISTHPELKTQKQGSNYYIPSQYYNLDKLPKIFRLVWHIYKLIEPFSFWRVKKILHKEQPDLIISHNLQGFNPHILKLFKNYRHIHLLHDIQLLHPGGLLIYQQEDIINTFSAKLYQNTVKTKFDTNSLIVSPSHWLLELHQQQGFFKNNNSQIILNPISTQDTSSLTSSSDSKLRILFVGQLTQAKGINLLLETFSQLPGSEFHLTILGSSSQLPKLKELYQKYSHIEFLGKKNGDQVKSYMQNSDALIAPSICYENSPTVIYEANNCNLPVIGSDLGGIKELIKKTGGLLFTPQNEDDLINKLRYMKHNYENIKITPLNSPSPKQYIELLRQSF